MSNQKEKPKTVSRPQKPTPMFRQFFKIKDKHPDCILFFRCGDFYEMYGDDAEKGAKLLKISLTSRDAGGGERIAMAGVPHHSAGGYIRGLIKHRVRVAVCEQLEDPKKAKGLVHRDVTRVITSGTVTDPKLLESDENNYLMSLVSSDNNYGLAITDVSTGEFRVTKIPLSEYSRLVDEIIRVKPSEVILDENLHRLDQLKMHLNESNTPWNTNKEPLQGMIFREILKSAFKTDKFEINWEKHPEPGMAAAALINYLNDTQKTEHHSLHKIEYYDVSEFMILDSTTWRNLELSRTLIELKKKGSLLWVLDNTKTAMGARLIRSWLERPLLNRAKINARLDAVEELINDYTLHTGITDALKLIYDLERITSRVVYASANARDLLALRNSLSHLPTLKSYGREVKSSLMKMLIDSLDTLDDIHDLVELSISEDPPASLKEGNIIKAGYNSELDELRGIRSNAKSWIAGLEKREKEKTGIKSLKVKFNNVFGYFIEVTRPNLHLVPDGYIRKQTVSNGERFISPELKEYESKVLGAEEKINDLEYNIFLKIRDNILQQAGRIQVASRIVAHLDCLGSLAMVAREGNYCRPDVVKENILEIVGGRHAVVEKMLDGSFVPNDCGLDYRKSRFHIITGPNMSGKSTYLRQIGLIAIMAQMGSFVPADSAKIGIIDRVFTRVGASDNLHLGKSTFLVEMSETANIINNASCTSLILLDEIGRGTSTYDGMSIAWSVSEYIHKHIKARTLFATHFHELTELAGNLEGMANFRVDVKETNREIIFLHHIVPGGTDKSYGIYVAKLAGLPGDVLRRAKEILDEFEEDLAAFRSGLIKEKKKPSYQLTFFDMMQDPLAGELNTIDPDDMSPREALDKIYEWKKKLK
ncbi:MAG: DNA mismatch repair protein MutS [Candidatus Eremiobacteraeota bacterium]|nr:DNA mismatch repair protein MutS [Candidatus Eremiobacteraeota bacterium]